MNKPLVLLSSLLLVAGALAGAQDTLGSSAKPGSQDQNAAHSQAATAPSTVVRGCLSGSAGNFTLTDQNGLQYKLVGNEDALRSKTGHEIEINGTEIQPTGTSSGQESMARTTNGFQVNDVRDVSGSCRLGRSGNSQPMSGSQPDKGADTMKPQLMAMLQQPASPAPNNSTDPSQQQSKTNSSGDQSPTPQSQTNPPAATSSAPNGMTPGAAQNGQDAKGQTTTSTPQSNTGAAAASSPGSTPANSNDQNKPLYERQATDVPWASHTTNGNTGATTSPDRQ